MNFSIILFECLISGFQRFIVVTTWFGFNLFVKLERIACSVEKVSSFESKKLVFLSLRCLATINPLRSQLFLDTYLLLDPLESITDRHIMVRSLQELWVITTRCGLQFLGIWFRNSLIVVSVWQAVVNLLKGSVLYCSLVAVSRFFACCPVVGKYTDVCEFASLIVKKPFFCFHFTCFVVVIALLIVVFIPSWSICIHIGSTGIFWYFVP